MGKGDSLLNVALETLDASIKQCLLLVRDAGQDIGGLLGTVGLGNIVSTVITRFCPGPGELTPSSMGTEKKSQPVFSAISLPPGTPGRYTKLGSTRPFSPLTALRTFSAKLSSC